MALLPKKYYNGLIINHHCIAQVTCVFFQAEDLDLADDIISVKRGHSASKNRYIYVNDRLNALPTSK